MTRLSSTWIGALLCIGLAGACSEQQAKEQAQTAKDAAATAASHVDLTKLSPEKLKETASSLVADLSAKLQAIKDEAGAKDLVKQFQPVVDQLVSLKSTMAANMPDMASLKKAVSDVTAKFANDPKIMQALQPLIDKLKTLVA
jgi:hypothetical protein